SPGMDRLQNKIGNAWNDRTLKNTLDWWDLHRDAITKAFHQNLAAIKSEPLRVHLIRNFKARSNSLDRLAADWHDNQRDSFDYLLQGPRMASPLDHIQATRVYPLKVIKK